MTHWNHIIFESLYAEPSKNGLNRPRRVRGNGYKMVNMGELFAYDRIRKQAMDLVPLNAAEQSSYALQVGDLLFARQSLVAEGTGKCSIILDASDVTTFESHIIRVRLNQLLVDSAYYYYYFSSYIGRGNIQSLVMQVAAAGIRSSELAKLSVPCPPLDTQHKIAAILSAYDDLIENNQRRIAILEDMASKLYREWFVDFRFPGHEQSAFYETELGQVPEGWEVKKLNEVCNITMGQSPESRFYNETGEGLPFHQGVSGFKNRFPEDHIYTTALNRIAERGDILFSVRAPVGRINLSTKKIIIGRGLCAIRSPDTIQPFIFQQLKDSIMEDSMGGGTIFKSVTKEDIFGIKLLIPDSYLISRFVALIISSFFEIENLTKKNANLRRTRDLLLPRLVGGELDVAALDIVEVADGVGDINV